MALIIKINLKLILLLFLYYNESIVQNLISFSLVLVKAQQLFLLNIDFFHVLQSFQMVSI